MSYNVLKGNPFSDGASPPDGYFLAWNGFTEEWEARTGPSGSFSAGGDLSGTSSSQTVIALRGGLLDVSLASLGPAENNYVLTWSDADGYWAARPGGGGGGFTAGGDLSGTSTNQTVIRINGATVPVSGSLVTGNVLRVSGASSLTYAAVNLAGGANHVTGVLPTANQAAQTMGGDVSGTTASATVIRINGTTVPAIHSTNQVIVATSGTTAIWSQIYDGYIAASANISGSKIQQTSTVNYGVIQLGGDLDGSASSQVVTAIQTHDVHAITPTDGYVLTWLNSDGYWAPRPAASNTPDATDSIKGKLRLTNDLGGTADAPLVTGLQSYDIDTAAPADGYVLTWINADGYWAPRPGPSGSFSAGGDLSGSSTNQTVTGIQTNDVAAQVLGVSDDGYVLTWDNANSYWIALPPETFTAGGDLSGTNTNQTVEKINGTSVPSGPSANQVLVATSGTTSIWSQIYDGYVAPSANIAGSKIQQAGTVNYGVIQIGGDLDGSASSQVVRAIQTHPVHAALPTDGYVLTWINADGYWAPRPTADGTPTGAAGGDLSGTYPNPTVAKIQGYSVNSTAPTDGQVLTYSGVDGYWRPEPPTDGYNLENWETVYTVDFSSLATQSFTANGNYTIDGKTWTVENFANATSAGVVNGTGIRLVCNTNSTDYINSTRTALLVKTKIKQLFPSFDLSVHQVRISAYYSHVADSNFENTGIGIEDHSSPMSLSYAMLRGTDANGWQARLTDNNSSTTASPDLTNVTDSVIQFTFFSPTEVEVRSGVYSSGYPSQENTRARRKWTLTNTKSPYANSDDIAFFYSAINFSAPGGFESTLIGLKVEVLYPTTMFNGIASGDLDGYYPGPTVVAIQNNAVYDQTLSANDDGYVLTWDNTDGYWVARPSAGGGGGSPTGSAGGDLSGTYPNPTVSKLEGNNVYTQVLGVSDDGYVLTWDGNDGYWIAKATAANSGDFGSSNITTTGALNVGGATTTSLNTALVTLGGKLVMPGIPTTSVLSNTDEGIIYFDSNSNTFRVSQNGGNYVNFITDGYAAGGDLSGIYANPTVVAIQNDPVYNHTLTSNEDGYVLTWENADGYWAARPSAGGGGGSPTGSAGGDLSGTYPNPTVAKIQGVDVSNAAPADGYLLVYNSLTSSWEPNSQDTAAAGWQGVYEVDFSALANQSFTANGNVTIDGKTWTIANFANVTSFGIVNGEGLKFVNNTTLTDYNNGTRTSPLITVPVSNLFPSFSFEKHELRLMVQLTQNGDANYELLFTGFEHATSPTSQSFTLGRGFSTADGFATKSTLNSTSSNPAQDTANVSDDINITDMYDANRFASRSALYSGGWPTDTRLRRIKFFTTDGDLPFEKTSDVNIILTSVQVNTSGTFVSTAKKLRLEVRTKGGGFTSNVAGGDLNGYYPAPKVVAIQNNAVYDQSLSTSDDGYVLTWDGIDGYWLAQPNAGGSGDWTTVGSEMYTTKTVSIDQNGTLASTHGDGYSKLYVNGKILATSYDAGEIALSSQKFGYVSDSFQSFQVPAGVTSIRVKMWGPGGGTGNYSSSGGGGSGGYSAGYLSVTPGETLYLAVGSGGKKPASSSSNGGLGGWPGGGFGTRGDASGGGGGGFTGVFTTNTLSQANALIIAGGGGGSTGFGNFSAGAGGGLTGGSGTSNSGLGGSQVAGGLGGGGSGPAYSDGYALNGGVAFTDNTTSQANDCGGGGSGYYGGGAGQGDGRAGGGGSGYLHPSRISGGVTTTGNNGSGSTAAQPPNTSDPDYIAGVGLGGAATGTGTNGGDGYIVFEWGGIASLDFNSLVFGSGATILNTASDIEVASGTTGKVILSTDSGIITLDSAADVILNSTTSDVSISVASAQKLKTYSSGAVVIGTATNNDTSAEAQANLTGALINLSSGTGSFNSTTNQALIFNQSGALNLQGNTEVRFNTSTSLRGYFDVNGTLRLGTHATSSTLVDGSTYPTASNNPLFSYNAGGSNTNVIISGISTGTGNLLVYNNAAGGVTNSGIKLLAAGDSHAVTGWGGNGIIEQVGDSASALVFSRIRGDNTSRQITGRIYQSGVWSVGDATNNDTSSEAQAGLTGALINISGITGGTLTSTTNQSLVYNNAGVITLQGHAGHSFITNTTTIASTNSNKFITNRGRRIATTVTTTNLTVIDGYETIIIGAITGSITITLPASPTAGDIYTIKDQLGNAATYNIIVSGNGNNIDGVSSYTLNANYESINVLFANGTWSIV